ncbi:hypothetical protein [Actinacidiphila glaucinigra]|uniref:hypothetical protein n=1 Tax=Actinacidiphila glaucinigra TaxID=235986 RepID=UPI0037F8B05E
MDADFIVELSSFLATRKKSKHFTPKDMRPITELRDAVRGVGAPGYLERVRADAAQRIAEPITGPVQIQIHRDADSQATLVTTLDLYAWFEQGTPAEKEALYLATFGMPARRDQRLRELALKSGVMGGLAHLPQPYVLAGFVMDHPTSVRVRGTAGSMELPALRTANEHHYGYVHTAGFALTMSTRVKHNGQYVHWMRAFTDPRSDALLRDHPDLLDFLYACRPDSTFAFDDPNGLLLTANLFEGLGESVNFAANYRSAQGMDGWDRVPVTVRDIGDLTSQHSLMFLAAAADPQINPIPRGLLLAGPEVEEEDCETETAIIHVPVVCNLTSVSIVAWFSGLGSALCRDGEPCGFKVDSYHSRRVEIHPLMESQSSFPQIPLGPRTLSWSDGRWGEADGPPSGWGDIRLRFEWD